MRPLGGAHRRLQWPGRTVLWPEASGSSLQTWAGRVSTIARQPGVKVMKLLVTVLLVTGLLVTVLLVTGSATAGPEPCDCTRNTLNCPDFPCQAEAQACYEHCVAVAGRDVHRLDRDNDGKACESLGTRCPTRAQETAPSPAGMEDEVAAGGPGPGLLSTAAAVAAILAVLFAMPPLFRAVGRLARRMRAGRRRAGGVTGKPRPASRAGPAR